MLQNDFPRKNTSYGKLIDISTTVYNLQIILAVKDVLSSDCWHKEDACKIVCVPQLTAITGIFLSNTEKMKIQCSEPLTVKADSRRS